MIKSFFNFVVGLVLDVMLVAALLVAGTTLAVIIAIIFLKTPAYFWSVL
jgi:hypothetical protein